MKKLTDQELDSVFKNAADGYEPAFDSAAWDAMNAKLAQPRVSVWKRWIPFAFLGLIIFSTGVWVGIYLNETKIPRQVQSETKKGELIQKEEIGSKNNQNQTPIPSHQVPAEKYSSIDKRQDEGISHARTKSSMDQDQTIENNRSIIVADNRNPIDEEKFILQEEYNSNQTRNRTDTIRNEITEVNADTTQSGDQDNKTKKEWVNSRSLYLRTLASPDFSSINYSSATSVGSNYALLFEYQFTNRWSVATGGIWSMKKYSTNEEVTYGKYTADSMVGTCRILDIPLNIYYRLRPQQRISFYAGVGFSSYIMLEEDYTYTVNYSSGSRDYTSYIEGKNNEWFKMLNLSIGMQYQIAPRFHLQAEPFLKAPLAGVGEGDVELSSMGIFLGIKYKIN